jgi:hypothetical protein
MPAFQLILGRIPELILIPETLSIFSPIIQTVCNVTSEFKPLKSKEKERDNVKDREEKRGKWEREEIYY